MTTTHESNGRTDTQRQEPASGGADFLDNLEQLARAASLLDQIRGTPTQTEASPRHANRSRPRAFPEEDRFTAVFDEEGELEPSSSNERRLERRFDEQVKEIHRQARRNNIRFAIGYVIFTSLVQICVNWEYCSWWVEENVLVMVKDIGIGEYDENFQKWSVARIDRLAVETEKSQVDEQLSSREITPEKRKALRDQAFTLHNELGYVSRWEQQYRSILDSYEEQHADPDIKQGYFRAKAKARMNKVPID